MIELRRRIERGVRHPVLGPLCLILLALLLAFTVMHGTHDQIHEGELIVCIAFLITALVVLIHPRLRVTHVAILRSSRAPPADVPRAVPAARIQFRAAPIPLRL